MEGVCVCVCVRVKRGVTAAAAAAERGVEKWRLLKEEKKGTRAAQLRVSIITVV